MGLCGSSFPRDRPKGCAFGSFRLLCEENVSSRLFRTPSSTNILASPSQRLVIPTRRTARQLSSSLLLFYSASVKFVVSFNCSLRAVLFGHHIFATSTSFTCILGCYTLDADPLVIPTPAARLSTLESTSSLPDTSVNNMGRRSSYIVHPGYL